MNVHYLPGCEPRPEPQPDPPVIRVQIDPPPAITLVGAVVAVVTTLSTFVVVTALLG